MVTILQTRLSNHHMYILNLHNVLCQLYLNKAGGGNLWQKTSSDYWKYTEHTHICVYKQTQTCTYVYICTVYVHIHTHKLSSKTKANVGTWWRAKRVQWHKYGEKGKTVEGSLSMLAASSFLGRTNDVVGDWKQSQYLQFLSFNKWGLTSHPLNWGETCAWL